MGYDYDYDDDLNEIVVYYHDISRRRHRAKRRLNALNWRKDRKTLKKYEFTDTVFSKKMLHRQKRRDPDATSSTYYKSDYSLFPICWART